MKLPSYGLVDLGSTFRFTLFGNDVTFRVNINNLLDTYYIAAESNSNIHTGDGRFQKHGKVLIRETQYGSDSDVLGTFLLNTDSKKQLKEIMGKETSPISFFT